MDINKRASKFSPLNLDQHSLIISPVVENTRLFEQLVAGLIKNFRESLYNKGNL